MDKQTVIGMRARTCVGAVLLVLAVAVLAMSAWGSCFPPPSGLVGWWPGEGNANDIQSTNNGTLQGGATANALGVVGQAFSFDGTNSYVQIPNAAALQPTNLTIEAWVRFASLDSAGSGDSPPGDQYIVFKQNTRYGDFEGFDLSKTRVTGGDVFRFLVTSATAQTAEIHSATLVTTGGWYHVAAVRGSNFTQIYVNGQLERQTNVTFAQNYGTLPLYFGTSGQSYWDHKLKGLLDEVSLYNRALSSNEVAAIYAAGAAGKCKAVNGLTITTQPQSQGVAVGSNAVFTVAASGVLPITYQWQFGGAAIPGATNTNLTLTYVQTTDAGSYAVVVTNSLASVTSVVAVLTVLTPPAITAQPQSGTYVAGTTAAFSAAASGSAPLSYQWQQNGVNLGNAGRVSGATGTTLTITSVQSADAGSYTLVVSDAAGTTTSTPAILTVIAPPVITTQPVSQSVNVGTNVSFSVTASGTSPLSYQWLFNGTNLADGGQFLGTASPVLAISNAQTTNVGGYSVMVTNTVGSVTSTLASLTVIVPGSCLPAAAGLIGWWPGEGNADDIVGSDNGTLQGGATATAVGKVGQAFTFDGTNSYVSIPDSPILRPTNLTIEAWVRFASLDSAGSGGSPAGDQYLVFKQNTRYGDFEGFDLSKTRVTGGDVFRFLLSSATAQTAQINSTTLLTTGVWYHVAAVRGSNFTQIYVNGSLQGQTTVSFPQDYGALPVYFGTSGQSYWDHKLKGSLDEVSLYNRALSSNEIAAVYAAGAAGKCKVVTGATITAQPQSQTVAVESNVLFTVTAAGTAPLSYQWQFDGTAMAGATNPNLTLANAQPANAGSYVVIVTNSASSVTSAVAVLTVLTPPNITTQPQSLTTAAGTAASFSATATGSAPLNYQWRLNGVNLANGGRISGATTNVLMISDVQATDAGSYTMVVSNGAGIVTSAVAILTVTGPPTILTQPVSQMVLAGANASFTVTASGTAPLSYQWRFNGANLVGATGTSLTLSGVQPANGGSYTVLVTNSVGSVTSAAAVLTVQTSTGSIVINGAKTYQVIDGFGVNANHRNWTNNELAPVLDALIDQAGMTLFRVVYDNADWETNNDNSDPNAMNWAYYAPIYRNTPDFQAMWGIMAYLNQKGITNGLMPNFQGLGPAWMGGENLTPGYENEWAEMIASALIYARYTNHLQFTVVGPNNEPDIGGSGVGTTAAQYVTTLHDLSQQLDANGMSDVRFVGPDLSSSGTNWLGNIMSDAVVMGKMGHFGLHSYSGGGGWSTGVYDYIHQSAYPDITFWMTEFNVWCQVCQTGGAGTNNWDYFRGTAEYLLAHLANGASAGFVWEGYDSIYRNNYNDAEHWTFWGLFAVNDPDAVPKTYTPRKNFYTLSQITAFVRPGAQRIDVSGSVSLEYLLAFYNTNSGQITLAGVNDTSSASSLSCVLTSLPTIPSLDLYYTSSSANLTYGGSVTVNNGAFSVMVPADCVFTLTYTNAVAGQTAPVGAAGPPTLSCGRSAQGEFELGIAGQPQQQCAIEVSDDLVNWSALTNVTLQDGTARITTPMSASRQFYRARLLP